MDFFGGMQLKIVIIMLVPEGRVDSHEAALATEVLPAEVGVEPQVLLEDGLERRRPLEAVENLRICRREQIVSKTKSITGASPERRLRVANI